MALRLNEGLGVDEAVVLGMRADPEPVHARFTRQAKRPVVQPDSGAVHLAATEKLKLQGRMRWIVLEQLEVLVCKRADFCWQRVVATPESR